MEWSEDGFVLCTRRHGEGDLVLSLLTRDHGRHAGLVKGGAGRRAAGLYEPGNRLRALWRARLVEHLGHFSCEALSPTAAALLDDPLRLAALTSAAALAETALPEREPHPRAYDGFAGLIHALLSPADTIDWAARYVFWELDLLAELGFGLDLGRCAVSGETEDLTFVSPASGRAVSQSVAGPYRDRLLPLPAFITGGSADLPAIRQGLALTGSFLERHALRQMPAARARFLARLHRA
ncbi:MAG: repair protein RecO [Rhodospirillaceae bacterium]|jgi:DNA repair protein RecO (recombination protein O)|nr:repair protein RecO [Rhodospirillaceae bacterium]